MWFIIGIIVVSLIYYWGQKNFGYWEKRGVPGPKPTWFVGSMGESLIGRKSRGETFTEIYKQFAGHAYVGIYSIGTPTLLVRDLDLFRNVLVKDFKHFQNNDFHMDKKTDRILARNPFFLKGAEWRQTRQALTACFTSGKIKGMFPLLENVSEKLVQYLGQASPMEVGEVSIRTTLNNVAACAFGLEGDCFEENEPEFRKLAHRFLSPSAWVSFVMVMITMFPELATIFKIQFIPKDVEDKLIDIVGSTLKYRKENNIKRSDFLEYVSEIGEKSPLFKEELEIVAQAATFFADGAETSSRVMRFTLFELAANPSVQEKLREEIITTCVKHGNKLTYESVNEMEYLDACLNESMRKYPALSQFAKVCTEKYTYTPTNPEYKNHSITIEPGTSIILPTAAVQSDPKYFENPDKFIPDRFFDKENITKFSFLPFGEGPRLCLGLRFGLTQIKLGIVQIVRNFKMTVNNKTKLPLTFDKYYFLPDPVGGLWVDFQKI